MPDIRQSEFPAFVGTEKKTQKWLSKDDFYSHISSFYNVYFLFKPKIYPCSHCSLKLNMIKIYILVLYTIYIAIIFKESNIFHIKVENKIYPSPILFLKN